MSTSDFFYISIGLGVWILVALVGFLTYQLIKFTITLRKILEDINIEYKNIKSGVKIGALTLLTKFLGKKGGGKNK